MSRLALASAIALALSACRLTEVTRPLAKHAGAPDAALSSLAAVSEDSAASISLNIQSSHVPFGTIIDPMYASGEPTDPGYTTLVGYNRAGDAAIWTGHYLAAESFRYAVTGSADALANVQRTLDAISNLVNVTGTGVLARFSVPAESPFANGILLGEKGHGIYPGTVRGQTLCWLGNTSRDQYSGVFFGLGVAYDMLNDAKMKRQISSTVTRMLDFLIANGWNVAMPSEPGASACPRSDPEAYEVGSTTFLHRPEMQLSFLQVGRRVNPKRFAAVYIAQRAALAPAVATPIQTECFDPHGSYYKFNLDHVNLYNLIRLEEESSPYLAFYANAFSTLRGCTGSHQNAHFNMIERGVSGADGARDAETVRLLELWLERPRRDYFTDLSDSVSVCGDRACDPVEVNRRPNTDFLWQRSPFQLTGGKHGTIETAGIDYLLPYWMARYYQVLQ